MKAQPYIHKTEMRRAFEQAGMSIKGNAGCFPRSGWSIDRAPKRRKRG